MFPVLESASPAWQEFLAGCIDIVANDRRPAARRLLALSWLYTTVATRVAVESLGYDRRFILMDEPVGYRPSIFDSSREPSSTSVIEYYEKVPPPTAIIYISADVDTIVHRITERRSNGMVALRHQKMSLPQLTRDTEWAIELADLGVTLLQRKQIPVLRLTAEKDLTTNVETVKTFFRDSWLSMHER